MNEVWVDILGYESLYKVSNTGKVFSYYLNNCLKPGITVDGYAQVSLTKNKEQKSIKIHRLVAMAFVPNPLNLPEVNHKDGNKLNNNDWNLEWSTHAENIIHAFDNGLMENQKEAAAKTGKNNGRLVLDTATGIFYDSLKEAAIAKCITYFALKDKMNPNKNSRNNTSLIYA